MTNLKKITQTQKKSSGNFLQRGAIMFIAFVGMIAIILIGNKIKNETITSDVIVQTLQPITTEDIIPEIVLNRYAENKKQWHRTHDEYNKKHIERENIKIRNTYPNINDYYDGKY